MYRINFVLMLSTIIPILDCCSSFTLFHRKSIDIYPASGIERLMHKSVHFEQNNFNETSPPDLMRTEKENQTTFFSHHKHHLHSEKNEESSASSSDEDDEHLILDLERIERSDLQNQETQLERALLGDHMHVSRIQDAHLSTENESPQNVNDAAIENEPPMEDAQYKLINEIVSLQCVDILRLEFCLNGGRCFLYPILNHSLTSCECAEGFVGERCEAKSYDFFPRVHRPRLVLAKTVGGPLVIGLAFIDILFLLFLFCKNSNRD